MSQHAYGANTEMLLLLAWLSTQDLREDAQQDRKARPWRYPHQTGDQVRQPVFPVTVVQEHITQALLCFAASTCGPAFEALVRYRLNLVDWECVAWAIDLTDLADPMCALYYSDDSYSSEHKRTFVLKEGSPSILDETDACCKVVESHVPLAHHLSGLAGTWHRDVDHGASELQTLFKKERDLLVQRSSHIPFVVTELLRISLNRVEWHRLAAHVLALPHQTNPQRGCDAQ